MKRFGCLDWCVVEVDVEVEVEAEVEVEVEVEVDVGGMEKKCLKGSRLR